MREGWLAVMEPSGLGGGADQVARSGGVFRGDAESRCEEDLKGL